MKKVIYKGVLVCPKCEQEVILSDHWDNNNVCSHCGRYSLGMDLRTVSKKIVVSGFVGWLLSRVPS